MNTLKYAERKQIEPLLLAHLSKREDGTCYYADGWSDHRIAELASETLQRTVTTHNIAGLRLETAGLLFRKRGKKVNGHAEPDPVPSAQAVIIGSLQEHTTQLDQRLAKLGLVLARLNARLSWLENSLGGGMPEK
jgi:hypothetical protein